MACLITFLSQYSVSPSLDRIRFLYIHRTPAFYDVVCESETWSLTLRKVCVPIGKEMNKRLEKNKTKKSVICILPNKWVRLNQRGWDGWGMQDTWKQWKIHHTVLSWTSKRNRKLTVSMRRWEIYVYIYIYIYIKAIVVLMCTEFVWFRVGSAADSCGCGNEISGYEQGGKFTFWETICFSRKT